MIALLLGIISLVIAIMFATSFDKLANEVRDVRIKYLKIDHILKLLKLQKTLNNGHVQQKDLRNIIAEDSEEDNVYEEDNVDEEDNNEDFGNALTLNNTDYYENVNFKENFKQGDIIEVFN